MIAKEIKEIIQATAEETVKRLGEEKVLTEERDYFKDTEQLLYHYTSLKDHVEDKQGYFNMLQKRSAGSVVRYSKNSVQVSESELLKDRYRSYLRSKEKIEQINKVLEAVKNRKEYRVLQLRYFERNEAGEVHGYDCISNLLLDEGIDITEKTVRRWKNSIVKDISIRLFGLDAI